MVFSASKVSKRRLSARGIVVVHITESFGGGVAAAIHDYVRNMPEVDHHLLYCPREDAPLASTDLNGFASVTALPSGFLRRLSAIRRHVDGIAPDVVHAHSSFGGAYARMALRSSASRPLVYTPHCYSFERNDLPPGMRLAYRLVEGVLSMNTGVYAGCSAREVRLSRWKLSRASVELLPNVSPRDLPRRRDVRPRGDSLRLVAAGRFGPQKDPGFFAEAVQKLKMDGRKVDAVWIGGGNGAYASVLENAGVRVTGWLEREDALNELANADIYVHVAQWEGFPIALLESNALGIPTVVRDIPAFEDVDVPLRIDRPEDLAAIWDHLVDDVFRDGIVTCLDEALANYTDITQQSALRRIYGIDAFGAIESI